MALGNMWSQTLIYSRTKRVKSVCEKCSLFKNRQKLFCVRWKSGVGLVRRKLRNMGDWKRRDLCVIGSCRDCPRELEHLVMAYEVGDEN